MYAAVACLLLICLAACVCNLSSSLAWVCYLVFCLVYLLDLFLVGGFASSSFWFTFGLLVFVVLCLWLCFCCVWLFCCFLFVYSPVIVLVVNLVFDFI